MKKLKLYLDTSVYCALYDERDKGRQNLTAQFWNTIGNYDLFFSDINLEEIDGISDQKIKEDLKVFLKKGETIEITEEVKDLTKIYLKEGVVPEKYEGDALQIALTTIYSLDILISWNFKHLVKRKTRIEVNLINLREGYRSIEILAPPEL